jgi:hypothetical protein
VALRPIFTDGLPFRTFFFQQTCALRLNEGDLPAVRSKGAGDNQVVLKGRIEQKGCQHVSGAIKREMTKKEILNNLFLSFNIIISNQDI